MKTPRIAFFILVSFLIRCSPTGTNDDAELSDSVSNREYKKATDSARHADSIASQAPKLDTTKFITPSEFAEIIAHGNKDAAIVVNDLVVTYSKKFEPILAFTLVNNTSKEVDVIEICIGLSSSKYSEPRYVIQEETLKHDFNLVLKPRKEIRKSLNIGKVSQSGDRGCLWISKVHYSDGTMDQYRLDWSPYYCNSFALNSPQ